MRIVGGTWRGRMLAAPPAGSRTIRPTTDRTRESLFNVLSHRWPEKLDGGRVLDLFAGTGGLAFEALSRGASFALMVDNSVPARGLIRQTMHDLGAQGVAKLFRRDATRLGQIGTMAPFDLVFADPPYGQDLGDKALVSLLDGGWLAPDALIVVEEAAAAPLNVGPPLELVDRRTAGDTALHFIVRSHDTSPQHV